MKIRNKNQKVKNANVKKIAAKSKKGFKKPKIVIEPNEEEPSSESEQLNFSDAENDEALEFEGNEEIESEAEASDDEIDEASGDDGVVANEDGGVEASENEDDGASEDDEASEKDEDDENEAESHKKALERLKETDPEFYSYLQENDKKLLQFNVSDDEDDDSGKEQDEVDDEEVLHKPTADLEVASDESDYEPEDGEASEKDSKVITLKLLKQWEHDIQVDKSNKTITCLVRAFHAALKRVSSPEDGDDTKVYYKVDGSSVFNAVIQLCVMQLGPAIRRFLGLKSGSKQPAHKCKKFVKVKTLLKAYFTDLLKLLTAITSMNILNVLLKHLHYVSNLLISFPNLTKTILKKLVHLWGTAEESVRVVAFLCLLRITSNQQHNYLDSVLRMMYMTYIKNSKFVSVTLLPGINFMRRSLVEMYTLDLNITYQHMFLFIRQLAINLRNAITLNKKENVQAVYNWQFVNSLKLWENVLSATCNKPQLHLLMYPFVQVCLGTVKLVPTTHYYPLRFHILQILVDLSKSTGVFVPILPFILEVLSNYDFNKKHQKVSMKPMHFTCVLRLSKSQLSENGFKDAVIDIIYGLLLEYMASQSNSIAFPDLALSCKLQLKAFGKKCNVANYQRKISQVLEKINQNIEFIEGERKKVTFNLSEYKQIDAWETTIKNNGTPLDTFFENWNKLRNIKKSKHATNNESIGDYKLPTLKKTKESKKNESEGGKTVLFPSDSEDEEEDNKKKVKRGKRGGKNVNRKIKQVIEPMDVDKGEDLVEDLNLTDW